MIDLARFPVVILDFDGVIVDSETLHARAWTRLARELDVQDRQITVAEVAGRLDAELAIELFPGRDSSCCVERKACIEAEMEAAGELRPIDGAKQAIRRLARAHVLALCSSSHTDTIARRLDRMRLRSFFQITVGRVDGLRHKPAPDLYLRVLEALSVRPEHACAIEDSPTGVAAAKAAGVYAIQIVHDGMPRAADADEYIASLRHVKTRRAARDRHDRI